ncbi:MAG: asparagine synthase (glutamine-hydrolyzing) [Altererythrobacter sp.]|nr:asparagine synthase (glutamine-hydrolyzing) [Altererythrobacter sp.]
MCGIFGAFNFQRVPVDIEVARAMSGSIRHRGPDAHGFFRDELALLGNRRLAILDLSEAGNQPIVSDDGRIIVVQNGEIYNFLELRDELKREGARFSSNSDTEVILRAFEYWGPEFVLRLNGMFAIAIYDTQRERLFLYRDRLGVKPLYVSGMPSEGRVWFGSEIKAILANGQSYAPDFDALAQYFALNYIPQPSTAFEGICHVPPGHMVELSISGGFQLQRYWDLRAINAVSDMTEGEARAELLRLLDDSTRIRMRSDAPFGAFLSGGLDSSSVVGFMSLYQQDPIQTFSIGFADPRFDETAYALLAAQRFGTIHQRRIMEPEATALWPKMIWHCDQPHGDVSFMPMLQVSELAASEVKMVLTGDGGDELFAGYEKYLRFFPGGQAEDLRFGWEDHFARESGLLVGDQAGNLLAGSLREAFFGSDPYRALTDEIRGGTDQDPVNRVLRAETLTLLPGNNLVKPDRMAMANSLEVRSPFLDYRMAEFAFQVPGALKLRDGKTKWIYKRAVEPLLGEKLTYRRKQMFTVPVGEWFRQALTSYCREIMLDGRLEERGIVEIGAVERMLAEHVAGTGNHTRQLRALISLELWYRLFIDRDEAALLDGRGNGNDPIALGSRSGFHPANC